VGLLDNVAACLTFVMHVQPDQSLTDNVNSFFDQELFSYDYSSCCCFS